LKNPASFHRIELLPVTCFCLRKKQISAQERQEGPEVKMSRFRSLDGAEPQNSGRGQK
jgi:hypothetical protein